METNNCSTLKLDGIMHLGWNTFFIAIKVPPVRDLSLVSLHLSRLKIVYPGKPNSAFEISLVSHVLVKMKMS